MDRIGLPYDTFITLPNCIDKYDKRLWALPKIYAYHFQSEPFLHIDGDVFVRTNLLEKYCQSRLVVQNIEHNVAGCEDILKYIFKVFAFIPPEIKPEDNSGNINFVNAGVFGGCDISLIRQYTQLALKFVEENFRFLDQIDPIKFNLIFEQYIFYNMFDGQHQISEIIKDETIDSLALHLPSKLNAYVHLVGENKRSSFNCLLLSYYLKQEFPDYYERILQFCAEKYGEKEITGHNKRFQPFYSYHASILERINDCTLDDLLNLRFQVTTKYENSLRPSINSVHLPKKEMPSWQQLINFFRKGSTGNDLFRRFRVDMLDHSLVARLKLQIADLLIINLIKEHNLKFI